MLTHKQIRKLARCYTDKRLVKDRKIVEAEGGAWWSNGFVAIWGEKPPPQTEKQREENGHAVLPADTLADLFTVYADREVYPVEIAPLDKMRPLRFADGNGTSVWVQGGFVSAILKRCRKRKVEVRYFVFGDKFPVGDKPNPRGVYITDGARSPVACVMQLHPEDYAKGADWNFRNLEIPSNGRTIGG